MEYDKEDTNMNTPPYLVRHSSRTICGIEERRKEKTSVTHSNQVLQFDININFKIRKENVLCLRKRQRVFPLNLTDSTPCHKVHCQNLSLFSQSFQNNNNQGTKENVLGEGGWRNCSPIRSGRNGREKKRCPDEISWPVCLGVWCSLSSTSFENNNTKGGTIVPTAILDWGAGNKEWRSRGKEEEFFRRIRD